MADKPIIFSAAMVNALLLGRKTQTRRVLNPQPYPFNHPENGQRTWNASGQVGGRICISDRDLLDLHKKPAPGDRLWVREAFRGDKGYDAYPPREMSHWPVHYEADGAPDPRDELGMNGRYRHARFMPRWASRLTLTVKNVWVERLQQISTYDVIAEGVSLPWVAGGTLAMMAQGTAKEGYRTLWNSLHPPIVRRSPGSSMANPATWDANPWVCALTFTVQRGNIDQIGAA